MPLETQPRAQHLDESWLLHCLLLLALLMMVHVVHRVRVLRFVSHTGFRRVLEGLERVEITHVATLLFFESHEIFLSVTSNL